MRADQILFDSVLVLFIGGVRPIQIEVVTLRLPRTRTDPLPAATPSCPAAGRPR